MLSFSVVSALHATTRRRPSQQERRHLWSRRGRPQVPSSTPRSDPPLHATVPTLEHRGSRGSRPQSADPAHEAARARAPCGKTTGACDRKTGKCVCLPCPAGSSKDECVQSPYTGRRCQYVKPVAGAACSTDADCSGGDTCIERVCTGKNPHPSPQHIGDIVLEILKLMATPQGIGIMAAMGIGEYVAKKAITAILRGAAYVGGEITQAVSEAIASLGSQGMVDEIGAGLAAQLVAAGETEAVVANTGATVTAEVAETAGEAVFGPLLAAVQMFQLVGMVLDVANVAGMQQQLTQDNVDALGLKMQQAVNRKLADNGITLPMEYLPENAVPFRAMMAQKAYKDKIRKYATDYISALRVNSNGEVIVPRFVPTSQKAAAAEHAKGAINPWLWSMSSGNERTFKALQKYWWLLFLMALALLGTVVAAVVLGVRSRNAACSSPVGVVTMDVFQVPPNNKRRRMPPRAGGVALAVLLAAVVVIAAAPGPRDGDGAPLKCPFPPPP